MRTIHTSMSSMNSVLIQCQYCYLHFDEPNSRVGICICNFCPVFASFPYQAKSQDKLSQFSLKGKRERLRVTFVKIVRCYFLLEF